MFQWFGKLQNECCTTNSPASSEYMPSGGQTPQSSHATLAAPSPGNQRGLERQLLTGRARVVSPGNATHNAKIIDANIEGVSVLMDLAIQPADHYTLHINCFRHGKTLNAQLRAVCMHSTLCGRGFKTGFRFENIPESVKTNFLHLLSQATK